MQPRQTTRSGAHHRLADPAWADPLDTSYSERVGGRWNPAGAFGALYLNRGERMARLQADHRLVGQPFGIEDLDPLEQHDLIEVEVGEVAVVDCVSEAGLLAAGLPASYPRDARGATVTHRRCQAVGATAQAAGLDGVACRSALPAASPADEELAVFEPPARERVRIVARRVFSDWYLGA